jgi:hypothetical protein
MKNTLILFCTVLMVTFSLSVFSQNEGQDLLNRATDVDTPNDVINLLKVNKNKKTRSSLRNDSTQVDYQRRLGLSSGFGSLRKFEADNISLQAPLLITVETSGELGAFDVAPSWLYYGGYLRISRRTNYSSYWSEYSVRSLGAGVRLTASVFPMLQDVFGSEVRQFQRFEVYGGFQAGYDYIWIEPSNIALQIAGKMDFDPVVGARFFPLKNLGIHAEIGGASGRTLTFGLLFQRKAN